MIIGIASGDYVRADRNPLGTEAWGGAGWARLGQYIPYLEAAGHEVHCGVLWRTDDLSSIEKADGTFVVPDVIILQRLMHDTIDESIRLGQQLGQIYVNDLDDWYWGLDSRNQAYKASHPKYNHKENTKFYWANVMASDYVTVSTPFLRDKIIQRGFKGEVILLPNTVDVGRFTEVNQQDLPTYGWVGSTHHRSGDLEILRGIFPKYLNAGKLKLHHSGHGDDAPTLAEKVGVPVDQVSTLPRCNTDSYPTLLTMDVGLVPLRDCDFNKAKSEIKGLEYAAAGIPFIASSSPSYSQLYKDWGTGMLLASKPKEWFRAIDKLLDKSVRIEYQSALLELVQKRDISIGGQDLVSFYESL